MLEKQVHINKSEKKRSIYDHQKSYCVCMYYTSGNRRSLKTCPALQLPVLTSQSPLERHLENLILASLEGAKVWEILEKERCVQGWKTLESEVRLVAGQEKKDWRLKCHLSRTILSNFHKHQKANHQSQQTKVASYLSPLTPGYI